MLVAILLGMHASAYFIFWNFQLYFCHDLCHDILRKCIYIFFLLLLLLLLLLLFFVTWVCNYVGI